MGRAMKNRGAKQGKMPQRARTPKGGPVPPQLTPFKKGQSGNPAGRIPHVRSAYEYLGDISTYRRDELEKLAANEKEPELKRKVARALLDPETDKLSIKEFLEFVFIKPSQAMDVNHSGEVTVKRLVIGSDPFADEDEK